MRDYDVIAAGGGIGGLVAAGLLSSAGLKVLLLEKEKRAGGYVTGFRRNGFYFDATGAFVPACGPDGELTEILKDIGTYKQIEFLPIQTIWNIYPDFDLKIEYTNPWAYLDEIKTLFPEYHLAVKSYEKLTRRFGMEFLGFEQAPWWKKILLPIFFPTLFRCARKSHAEILNKFFHGDPHLTLALSDLPTTLPPSQLSYAFVGVLWAKVLGGGVFYPKGGMSSLSDALVSGIVNNGGEIRYEKEVTRIITNKKQATGVLLSDNSKIMAEWVIADINPFEGEKMLPGNSPLFGYRRPLAKYKPSLSALLFYLAVPAGYLPSDWPYFISIHTSRDIEAMSAALERGSMGDGLHIVITTPSIMDSALAPSGYHAIKVLVRAPRTDLFEKEYGSDPALGQLQGQIFSTIKSFTGLDITSNALFVERATPMTLLRRTGNEAGAMYGLDAACNQVGPFRPPNRTVLDNLLWVGHYTHPAHGIVGSAMSGRFAAKIVLKNTKK